MAVSITHVLASGNASPGATQTISTASFLAKFYKLYLVAVGIDDSSGGGHDFSLSGLGVNWQSIKWQPNADGYGRPVELFYGLGKGQTGQLSINDAINFGNNPVQWAIAYLDSVKLSSNGGGAIVQNAGAGVGGSGQPNQSSINVSLGAFNSVDNATFGVCMINGSGSINTGSGFSQVSNDATSNKRMQTQFKTTNDTGVDWSFGSSQSASAIAIELAFGYDLNRSGLLPLL